MADRRIGDRREKEKGVIRINFKDLIVYLILAIIIIIQLVLNIILFRTNKKYEEIIEEYQIEEYDFDDYYDVNDDYYDVNDDYEYYDDYEENEIDNNNTND